MDKSTVWLRDGWHNQPIFTHEKAIKGWSEARLNFWQPKNFEMSACFKVAGIRSLAKAVHQCPELRSTAT